MKKTLFFDNMVYDDSEEKNKYNIVPGEETKNFHIPKTMDIPDVAIPYDMSQHFYSTTDRDAEDWDDPILPDDPEPEDPDTPDPGPEPPEPPTPEPEYGPITIMHTSSGTQMECVEDFGVFRYTLDRIGNYIAFGGTKNEPAANVEIVIAAPGTVNFEMSNLFINNQSLFNGNAVITVTSPTTQVTFNGTGESVLTSGKLKCSVIDILEGVPAIFEGETSTDTENNTILLLGGEDSDNIYCNAITSEGDMEFRSGEYAMQTNGTNVVCLDGNITLSGGTLIINSEKSGLQSSADIEIHSGSITVNNCFEPCLLAPNGHVAIDGGSVYLNGAYSDGIRSENFYMSAGSLFVTPKFEQNTRIFFDNDVYNHVDVTDDGSHYTLSELIRLNTGSHHALHIGTEGKVYHYDTDPSELVVLNSGECVISGGYINLDTSNTGSIRRNEQSPNEFVVLGSPSNGILCYGNITIDGGEQNIKASAGGIQARKKIDISNGAATIILKSDIGVIAEEIFIDNDSTYVDIESNYIGMLGLFEDRHYTYTNTTMLTYQMESFIRKTGNLIQIAGGTITILSTYGNAITCLGAISINGGLVKVFTTTDNTGIPIYVTENYDIGTDATLLFGGPENAFDTIVPATSNQAYLIFKGTFMARTDARVSREETEYIRVRLPKKCNAIFFTCPDLEEGLVYVLTAGSALDTAIAQKP